MEHIYKRKNTSAYSINYHIIFCPKFKNQRTLSLNKKEGGYIRCSVKQFLEKLSSDAKAASGKELRKQSSK